MRIETRPAADALAHEAALLAEVSAAPGRRHLWLWQSPQALVAPRKLAALPSFQAAAAQLEAEGWPVSLRATGGDVTPQGPGIVNVTHVYTAPRSKGFDLDREYARLCAPIETALGAGASRGWQPGAFCDGAHNVQWNGLKFAGTAMRFRPCKADKTQMAVLAHALMLFEPPNPEAIAAINRCLAALDQDRRIDLAAHTGLPLGLSPEDFVARLVAAFDDALSVAP